MTVSNEATPAPRIAYRRSPHVIAFWSDGELVFENYATGMRVPGTALTIGLLTFFSNWRDPESVFRSLTLRRDDVSSTLDALLATDLLQRSDREPDPRERALEAWQSWNPSVGFFHAASRNCDFGTAEQNAADCLYDRLATRPQPACTKQYTNSVRMPLLTADRSGTFASVLLQRRTWRQFGTDCIDAQALATLLGLTFGVQQWVDQEALGRAMLRTSPSGGARHPIEAYVVVQHVEAIAPGVYHYAPDTHELALLQEGDVSARLIRYLPGQPFYSRASAVVLMTAVFARTEWQYPFPRAYRVVHLEAGHFCQTFCLVATSLGLAPFCTAALADSVIETDLSIDGVTESVLYACGVGTRPPGVAWAPWPDGRDLPRLFPPKHASR